VADRGRPCYEQRLVAGLMSVPAFVYVVPARFEDILKIGFSRDPCHRIRSFHKRYFEYFDLDRGFLIAANDEKDARRIERLLALRFSDHRTHAPLVIEQAPGGVTEWYRGASPLVLQVCTQIVVDEGYPPLISAAARIRQELLREREHLFEHATAVLDAVDGLGGDLIALDIASAFRNSMDAFRAFDIPVAAYLPEERCMQTLQE
jgi:hypothetical protein